MPSKKPSKSAPKAKKVTKGGTKKAEKSNKNPSFSRRVIRFFIALGLWSGLGVSLGLGAVFFTLPDPTAIIKAERRTPSVVLLDQHGEPFHRLRGHVAKPVYLLDLPDLLPKAFLAVEDRRFYHHFGLDPMGIARAAYHNIRVGGFRQGGSTITQQVAKNLFLTPERTLFRKVQEMMLSFWLEYTFTKTQILEIYLNRIYLGSGVYGIASAAQQYFGKSPAALTLPEIALLAGLPKAPSRYSPLANPKAASKRALLVVDMLSKQSIISNYEKHSAIKALQNPQTLPVRNAQGSHFHRWIFQNLESLDLIGSGDLIVHTTLDATLQAIIEQQILQSRRQMEKENVGQAAIVTLDKTGAVRAMIGSVGWENSEFNRATQARRQMGSVFKIIVYAAALQHGLTPDSMIDISQPTIRQEWWPEDSSQDGNTVLSLREGMARSSNAMAVTLSQMVGRKTIIRTARQMGISVTIPDLPSIALGVAEIPLLEMTAAMAVIAADGVGISPYGITRIADRAGNVLFRQQAATHRVLAPHISAQMQDMLGAVLETGTGRAANSSSALGGKTGTTQNHRDALFIGYGHSLITGIWLGNDAGQAMRQTSGGGLPAKLFFDISRLYAH